MTGRKKLEELLCSTMKYGCGAHCTYPHCFRVRNTADHLIAHGVTVLPCDIGERVFCILHNKNEIVEDIVEDYDIWSIKDGVKLRISLLNHKDYVVAEFGKTIFLTREEAEKEMEGGADV